MGLFFLSSESEGSRSIKMGISRDHLHKRRATGGKRAPIRNKRKFELARPAAVTKLGAQRIHTVRVRGGNKNTGLSVSIQEISPGGQRPLPGRPVSSTSSTTPVTMSWSEPRPSSKTPS